MDEKVLFWTALFEYKFNLKNNRFLRAYLAGYVNGMNENSDTPCFGWNEY